MDVIALDCDGVLMDSIPEIIKICVKYVGRFFPVKELNTKKAEELVVYFGGESFSSGLKKALESLYPESLYPGKENEEKREKCHQMIMEERVKIYDKVKPFPGAVETVKKLVKDYHLVVSSGLEYGIIETWLGRNGPGKCLFDMICSQENGKKKCSSPANQGKIPRRQDILCGGFSV